MYGLTSNRLFVQHENRIVAIDVPPVSVEILNPIRGQRVGIGLDYVVDKQELTDYIEGHPDTFPPDKISDYLAFVEPEQFPEFTELLYKKGYDEQIIRGVFGRNFLRVAKKAWK